MPGHWSVYGSTHTDTEVRRWERGEVEYAPHGSSSLYERNIHSLRARSRHGSSCCAVAHRVLCYRTDAMAAH